jgi:response regulator receiver domain-containing protein
LERPRVLLVDDTPEMIEYYGELLHAGSYDIVGAALNAAVALHMVRETKPQVVLLDISMPGMNGIELARRLRATGWYAALIFVVRTTDLPPRPWPLAVPHLFPGILSPPAWESRFAKYWWDGASSRFGPKTSTHSPLAYT